MPRFAAIICAIFIIAACATVSPRARIENRFVEFGLSEGRAHCLAENLDKHLDRSDLAAVADFVGDLNQATSAGEALDALLGIDNPRAAAAIARASVACAFSRD